MYWKPKGSVVLCHILVFTHLYDFFIPKTGLARESTFFTFYKFINDFIQNNHSLFKRI